jgi:ATP-dependent RNA helicase DeaD
MDNEGTAFESFALSPETQSSLAAMGYRYPTACQQETLPRALAGRDLVVQSRTGTGKTAAFGIPIVERVDVERAVVQALILAPTRELALQVSAEMASLGRGRGVKLETVYGGDPIERQLASLESGVHVVAGTPGRVLDHLRRGSLDLTALRVLVLDEADRMLDMGFAVEMGQIMEYVPDERQTLLFSATVPLGIRGVIYHYMNEPEWLLLSEDQVYVKEVEHLYCLTPKMNKEEALYRLIEHENVAASMVFCNTREETRRVHAFLESRGLPAAMLSSDLAQRRRERVMEGFRSRQVRHLVTTDVASRGIDIEDLSHVFVYSTPESPEQYIHRAGRTGRIGKGGRVISLVSAHDLMSFNRLVRRYTIDVGEVSVPSEEEMRASQAQRVVGDLTEKAGLLAPEEVVGLLPIAKGVMAHAQGERLIATLLKAYLAPPAVVAEPDEEATPAPPPSAPKGQRRGRGRRGQRRA